MKIRTRFAPSPTGYLHVGTARTALYSWLYARRFGGKFILRIEDTDLERSTPEAVQTIFDGLDWLGLDYDEEPVYQTQRFDRYKEVIQKLLDEGKAYRCSCTKERLEALRNQQLLNKEKPRYDGRCRDLDSKNINETYVVRFKNPLEGEVVVDDQVHGRVVFQNTELDDLIIARSDGVPTYNFTVVVDDWDMQISHVIRGDDHLNNTPRQINMLKALGATLPIYAHVPMILGNDGKKLSKRHGAVSVMQYRDEGFLPEALLNYLVRLGWSHGDQEIFSRDEMVKLFDIKDLNKSAAAFNNEKLQWLNQHYIKTSDPEYLARQLEWHIKEQGIDLSRGPNLIDLILVQRERVKTLKEMVEKSQIFYRGDSDLLLTNDTFSPEIHSALQALYQKFASLSEFSAPTIHSVIRETVTEHNLKFGDLVPSLRLVLTGSTVSPSIDATVALLGKTVVLKRLQKQLAL